MGGRTHHSNLCFPSSPEGETSVLTPDREGHVQSSASSPEGSVFRTSVPTGSEDVSVPPRTRSGVFCLSPPRGKISLFSPSPVGEYDSNISRLSPVRGRIQPFPCFLSSLTGELECKDSPFCLSSPPRQRLNSLPVPLWGLECSPVLSFSSGLAGFGGSFFLVPWWVFSSLKSGAFSFLRILRLLVVFGVFPLVGFWVFSFFFPWWVSRVFREM